MTKEELSIFSDPLKPAMSGPFSVGDFSYATNGHILVRVPRLSDVPEWEALNEKATRFFDEVDYEAANSALVDIPEFEQLEPAKCTLCKGVGKITKCPECDGEGEVVVENDYNEYECTCKTCDGEGSLSGNDSICPACEGTGNKIVVDRIPIGHTGFSSHYLTQLQKLPGIKIAPTSTRQPNYFKWDGGDGLLMPMLAAGESCWP